MRRLIFFETSMCFDDIYLYWVSLLFGMLLWPKRPSSNYSAIYWILDLNSQNLHQRLLSSYPHDRRNIGRRRGCNPEICLSPDIPGYEKVGSYPLKDRVRVLVEVVSRCSKTPSLVFLKHWVYETKVPAAFR